MNFTDLAILADGWTFGLPAPDLNGDNRLGWADVLELAEGWLACNRTDGCWQ